MAGRRLFIGLAGASLLAGCGFALRKAPNFAFSNLYIGAGDGSAMSSELRRNLATSPSVRVIERGGAPTGADAVLDLLNETREKVVVGLSASGQVREFQLRLRVRFRLRTPQGKELIPETALLQERDISFNESAVLAKEAEEGLLYRDMQTDLVQQLMRRLAAVKSL
ncbi:MAG TPA: LPS assembly lipoprotein LptE [Ramlibacter sp.]|nr:LPS assembly lipoprotein LptE [Ramlibacter sp.]